MLDELDNLNQIVEYQEYLEAEQANIAAKRIENLTGNFKIQNHQELVQHVRNKLRSVK